VLWLASELEILPVRGTTNPLAKAAVITYVSAMDVCVWVIAVVVQVLTASAQKP